MAKLRRAKDQIEQGLGHEGIQFGEALAKETDRGCALIAAEFISDTLEQYFRREMHAKGASENEIRDFLTSAAAPLGNFSPRIKAAYWFGLIGKNTYGALDNIKEIRNQCAHRAGPIDFTDTELAVYVRGLGDYWAGKVAINSEEAGFVGAIRNTDGYSPQRLVFTRCATMAFLTVRILAVNPPEVVRTIAPGTIFDGKW